MRGPHTSARGVIEGLSPDGALTLPIYFSDIRGQPHSFNFVYFRSLGGVGDGPMVRRGRGGGAGGLRGPTPKQGGGGGCRGNGEESPHLSKGGGTLPHFDVVTQLEASRTLAGRF